MNRVKNALPVIAGLLLIYFGLPRLLPPGTVEYRGEEIQLARWYWSYDDYKSDPDGIPVHERARVEALVREAPLKAKYRDLFEMATAVSRLRFPGFGSSSFGERPQANGMVLAGRSIEIPNAGLDRVFVFQKLPDGYALVDDFVASNEPGILGLRLEANALVFTTFEGTELLRRPVPAGLVGADRREQPGTSLTERPGT